MARDSRDEMCYNTPKQRMEHIRMKIAVLDGFLVNPGDISWEPIAGQGEFVLYESTEPQELTDHIGNAEAVFVNRL